MFREDSIYLSVDTSTVSVFVIGNSKVLASISHGYVPLPFMGRLDFSDSRTTRTSRELGSKRSNTYTQWTVTGLTKLSVRTLARNVKWYLFALAPPLDLTERSQLLRPAASYCNYAFRIPCPRCCSRFSERVSAQLTSHKEKPPTPSSWA